MTPCIAGPNREESKRRRELAEARAQRNALVNGIEAEISYRRELGRKNASRVHLAFADRLEEIRDKALAS